MLKIFLKQSILEQLFIVFYTVLFIYELIAMFVIRLNYEKKSINQIRKGLCIISYVITALGILIGCFVETIMNNPYVYFPLMLVSAIISNLIFVWGKDVLDFKFKDVELIQNTQSLVDYAKLTDLIMACQNKQLEFFSNCNNLRINSSNQFISKWGNSITYYLSKRGNMSAVACSNVGKVELANLLSDLSIYQITKKHKRGMEAVLAGKGEYRLSENIVCLKLSGYCDCYICFKAKSKLERADIEFLKYSYNLCTIILKNYDAGNTAT